MRHRLRPWHLIACALIIVLIVNYLALVHRQPQPRPVTTTRPPVPESTPTPGANTPPRHPDQTAEPLRWRLDITGRLIPLRLAVLGTGDLYVRKTGTIGAACSNAAPCRNFKEAFDKLALTAGGTLHVGVGNWNTSTDINPGAPDDGICDNIPSHTLIVGEGATPTDTIITAYSRTIVAGCEPFIKPIARSEIIWQNITLDGNLAGAPAASNCTAGTTNSGSECALIVFRGGAANMTWTDVVVRQCHLVCVAAWHFNGFDYDFTDFTFTRTEMHHCGQATTFDHCIYANNVIRFLYQDGWIHDSAEYAIQIQADKTGSSGSYRWAQDVTVTRTKLTGNGGGIYLLNVGGTTTVSNSIIADNGKGIWNYSASNLRVIHTTLDDNDQALGAGGYPHHIIDAAGYGLTLTNSILTNNSVAVWKQATGTIAGSNNIILGTTTGGTLGTTGTLTSAPTYTSPTDWHLVGGSVGIDSAVDLSPPLNVDYDNQARLGFGQNDIGADELVGTPPVPPPAGGCVRHEAETLTPASNTTTPTMPTAASAGASNGAYRNFNTPGTFVDLTLTATGAGPGTVSVRYQATAPGATRRLWQPSGPTTWTLAPAATWTVATLPLTFATGTTTLSFSWEPADVGALDFDYLDVCAPATGTTTTTPATTTTSSTTTTLVGGGRLITLIAWRDQNLDGIRTTAEGPLAGATWTIKSSANVIVKAGTIGATGTATAVVPPGAGYTVTIRPPTGQSATTATTAALPASGPATVTVGGCCPRRAR